MMPTALIVDDEPQANALIAMLVETRGYTTSSAYDAADAERTVRDAPPDVVLLDLMLPDRSGLDVCRALTSAPETCHIPIVIVSARLADRNRTESYRAGACDFVPKPFTPEQIFTALEIAADWKAALEEPQGPGKIPLSGGDDAYHRSLAHLRGQMIHASPGGTEAFTHVAEFLELARVRAKSRSTRTEASYRLELPWLHLAFELAAGWAGDPALQALCSRADTCETRVDGEYLRLSCRIDAS